MATPHEAAADDPVRRDVVLAAWVRDARRRTMEVVEDLSDEQLLGPQLRIVNPLLWEIGHVTWFQEKWALRHAGGEAPTAPRTAIADRESPVVGNRACHLVPGKVGAAARGWRGAHAGRQRLTL